MFGSRMEMDRSSVGISLECLVQQLLNFRNMAYRVLCPWMNIGDPSVFVVPGDKLMAEGDVSPGVALPSAYCLRGPYCRSWRAKQRRGL